MKKRSDTYFATIAQRKARGWDKGAVSLFAILLPRLMSNLTNRRDERYRAGDNSSNLMTKMYDEGKGTYLTVDIRGLY